MRMRLKPQKHSASPGAALDLLACIQKHTAHIGDGIFKGTSKTTQVTASVVAHTGPTRSLLERDHIR